MLAFTQVGSHKLHLYHRRPTDPVPVTPSLAVQVAVHATAASPELQTIIRACEAGASTPAPATTASAAAAGLAPPPPPLSLAALCDHPYFLQPMTLSDVADDFEMACF